ncbi:MAG: hypothetical protein MI802_26385 [Desulfobacterales bacterium]|nr:hypothetical protein [Desulfobacterales bacterium]
MKKTAWITLMTLILGILCMYHTSIAAELSLFSPFDNQQRSHPNDAATSAIGRFDLERPEVSDTVPLTRDDAIGLFTDTPASGDNSQGHIARLIALKAIYELGTDPVFDTDWEGFADRLAGSDIWKDSFSNTQRGMRIEEALVLLSADSREIRKLMMNAMAERRSQEVAHERRHAADRSVYTGSYRATGDELQPEPEQEYETERIRASDEADGLFFGFNLDTTTIILLSVGFLIVLVVCKRLPY